MKNRKIRKIKANSFSEQPIKNLSVSQNSTKRAKHIQHQHEASSSKFAPIYGTKVTNFAIFAGTTLAEYKPRRGINGILTMQLALNIIWHHKWMARVPVESSVTKFNDWSESYRPHA